MLNVAWALYAVKRDNGKQCSGLENHWLTKLEWYGNVFSSRQKVMRDDADRTIGGRLFQARGVATGNDRSPKVDLLTGGTMRDVVADERRWRHPSTSATRQMLSAR